MKLRLTMGLSGCNPDIKEGHHRFISEYQLPKAGLFSLFLPSAASVSPGVTLGWEDGDVCGRVGERRKTDAGILRPREQVREHVPWRPW